MTIKALSNLKAEDQEMVRNAPIYVSLLIAGADSKIDKLEMQKAVEIARGKQSSARAELMEFYQSLGQDFEQKFKEMLDSLPAGAEKRTEALTLELRKLNLILPKVDRSFSIALYASLKDFAKKVAEASGGILGYMSVSYEESKLMELRMIQDPSTY